MFLSAGRRLFGLVVSVFALLGFMAVPIGDRTGYEHLKAILATPQAAQFGTTLGHLLERLKDTLSEELDDVGAAKEGESGEKVF